MKWLQKEKPPLRVVWKKNYGGKTKNEQQVHGIPLKAFIYQVLLT